MIPDFSSATALADLRARTAYEVWFLEAVFEVAGAAFAPARPDLLELSPSGLPLRHLRFMAGHADLGDWRPGFLNAGSPLVFVTEFKLLDMFMEWVLGANGVAATFRFTEKIGALKGARTVVFPASIESRTWLRQRLVALYEHLEPLRGTIIHARHFTSSNGAVTISRSKGNVVGPPVTFSADDLRRIASVLVWVIGEVSGTTPLDAVAEKRLRLALDGLATHHRLPSLGQLPPSRVSACVYARDTDPVVIDVAAIRAELAKQPDVDTVMEVCVVLLTDDVSSVRAFQIAESELSGPIDRRTRAVLEAHARAVPVPGELNLAAAREAMGLG